MPPTIAARWMTSGQPSIAVRACFSWRRSPVCTSQPSRIHCGAGRWSETRTSYAGSASSRLTTAAPIVPAPPVTSTRVMGLPPRGPVSCARKSRMPPARAGGMLGFCSCLRCPQNGQLARIREHLTCPPAVPRVYDQTIGACPRGDGGQRRRFAELVVVGRHDHDIRVQYGLLEGHGRGGYMRVVRDHIGQLALE